MRKNGKGVFLQGLLTLLVCFLIVACVSAPPPQNASSSNNNSTNTNAVKDPERKTYTGFAQAKGDTFLNARNAALMEAVKKAVIEMIGTGKEAANKDKLASAIYNGDVSPFIYKDSVLNTKKDMLSDDFWQYECSVDVNLIALKSRLSGMGLLSGDGNSTSTTTIADNSKDGLLTDKVDATKEQTEIPVADYGAVSEEEKAYIARYVDKMTYMVYFDKAAAEDLFYVKGAVGKANEYLVSQSLDIIDAEQVEKLKEEQQLAYEAETGESMSIIQWIAQKLNSDIYIEIFAKTEGNTQLGGKHYGTAQIELKAYEASTAMLMGSASYNTLDAAYSTQSQQAARLNAIQGAVYKTMPRLVQQVKDNMKKSLFRGIRYEVIIQKPLGDRAMSRFWDKLKSKAKDIKLLSQSAEEVKAYLWFIGSVNDLKSVVYDVTEQIAGLENLEMILARGKSLTFNTRAF
jgi:hypothetical protein